MCTLIFNNLPVVLIFVVVFVFLSFSLMSMKNHWVQCLFYVHLWKLLLMSDTSIAGSLAIWKSRNFPSFVKSQGWLTMLYKYPNEFKPLPTAHVKSPIW